MGTAQSETVAIRETSVVAVPSQGPIAPTEIERRRALYKRVIARRARMEPLGVSASELIRQVRDEVDDAE